MNYYRRYSGDYLRDTARLSMLEHGAYNLLLDYYYSEEQPLPNDLNEIYMMVRAMTPADRKAVDKVLGKYFTQGDDGYRNSRADHEIEVSQKARNNGQAGGRPARKGTGQETGSETKDKTGSETGTGTGKGGGSVHPPTTNHQPPTASPQPPKKDSAQLDGEKPKGGTPFGAMATALREKGVNVTPANPMLVGWIQRGLTVPLALEAVARARLNKPEPAKIAAAYLNPIVDDVLTEAANPQGQFKNGSGARLDWWMKGSTIEAKAKEHGIELQHNEDRPLGEYHDQLRCAIAAKIGLGPWINTRNATDMRFYEHFLQKGKDQ